jgi:RNA polymerase sigma factor (sigma-70 family)
MPTHHSLLLLRHLRHLAGPCDDTVSDCELLHRFTERRDEVAFASLMRRHGPMVLRVCRRVLPYGPDAEDAFQTTFLTLARKAGAVRWHDSAAGWLYGVASNTARRARDAAARRAHHECSAPARVSADPLAEMSARELLGVLDEELSRLPEKYREPLVLCYLEGAAREEAAQRLGCPLGTLKGRLERGKERLRLALARRGLSLPAALGALLLGEGAADGAVPAPLARSTLRAAVLTSPAAAGVTMGKLIVALFITLALVAAGVGLGRPTTPAEPHQARAARNDEAPQPPAAAPRADLFGDPLPRGALARLGTLRFRPGLPLGHVAFSADGRRLVTATMNMESDDNLASLCLWDRTSGKRLRQFGIRKTQYLCLALAPDGKTLATQDLTGAIALWDTATGKEVRQITRGGVVFPGGPGAAGELQLRGTGFTLSPDGKFLAARGPDRAIHLWATATGKEVRKLTADPEDSSPLAFSRDGKILATSAADVVRLWEVATGKVIARLTGHKGLAGTAAFSPDGKTFTALARTPGQPYQMTAYVWDVAAGKVRYKWDLAPNFVSACCISPDGASVLVGGHVDGMRLYDLSTGKELTRLRGGFRGTLFAAAFSPDGQTIAAGGENRVLQLWDTRTGKLLPSSGHQGIVESLSLSADGKQLASIASDEGIRLWDVATGRPVQDFRSPRGEFLGVAFLPGGKLLAAGRRDCFVRLLEAPTGQEVRRFEGAPEGHIAVAVSPDGKVVAAGGGDGSIHLWETATGKRLLRLQQPSPDPRRGAGVGCLAFSHDGRRLASTGWEPAACVWDLATGKRWCELSGHKYWISSPCFSPDGKTLAVAHWDKTIRLWEVTSGKERGRLSGHAHRVTQLAFAPDGRLASASHDGTVRVWDLLAAAEMGRFVGHEAVVGPLAFSADGNRLVSGGWDTTMLVWDVQGLQRPARAKPAELSPKEREALWAALAGTDASEAYRAIRTLARAGEQAASFLADHLKPATAVDAEKITRLIEDLESERFPVRANAEAELTKLEDLAEPALRRALEGKPRSLELRRRIERLLERLEVPIVSGQRLRVLRAVEVLEQVGTPRVPTLRRLSAGAPAAWLTREAKAALGRVERRAGDR